MTEELFKAIQRRAYEKFKFREWEIFMGFAFEGDEKSDWIEAEEEFKINPKLINMYGDKNYSS